MRSIHREWQCQRRDHPRRLKSALLIWVVFSASLAGVLAQQRWQLLQQRQSRQGQTDQGLLELRANSHKITVLDWGHWDPLYAYAGGDDPSFASRELEQSSIIQDGQGLLLVDAQQRTLLAKGTAIGSGLSAELSRCLKRHLQQLAAHSQAGQGDQAFGFYCPAPSTPCWELAPRSAAVAAPGRNGAGCCAGLAATLVCGARHAPGLDRREWPRGLGC
jgi:hypothetical protein